ncbi:hypothetical protein [Komagataeibacter melaceti]|uniref:hypothetical protein n=1 Tax=Komagataeibacter melaceti TaxID=2766577 RepID=UPI0011E58FFF|nr:hypothetical protein [Komagataeibacter melaceti]
MKDDQRRQRQRQRQRQRAAAIRVSETKALIIVLGIPQALVGEVKQWVSSSMSRPVNVLAVPATNDDNRPYNSAQVSQVFQTAVKYAERKRRAEQQPAPAYIMLLYVPGQNDEAALAPFDFFVFPVPLHILCNFDNGRQLRHDHDKVKQAIQNALNPTSENMRSFQEVQKRVNAVRDAEPLQLPPENFFIDKDIAIRQIFRMLRRGERPWDDIVKELTAQEFDKDRLPRLKKGIRRRAYQDARGLVFLRAELRELHGANRELSDAENIEEDATSLLRGSFRFGCPLLTGFHHDVQLEHNRPLNDITFKCGTTHNVKCGNVYINVYPNDIVRGKKLAAL